VLCPHGVPAQQGRQTVNSSVPSVPSVNFTCPCLPSASLCSCIYLFIHSFNKHPRRAVQCQGLSWVLGTWRQGRQPVSRPHALMEHMSKKGTVRLHLGLCQARTLIGQFPPDCAHLDPFFSSKTLKARKKKLRSVSQ
jgi:hypothetical protein